MPAPSLAHFAIFNPSIPPPAASPSRPAVGSTAKQTSEQDDHDAHAPDDVPPVVLPERDRDLEDDLAQAAQIIFYTSSEGGGVSRDRMLRQVGLVKGLMSFSDSVAPGTDPWFSVHSLKARMLVYTADAYHFYLNIADAAGLSDQMLVDCLKRGYADYCLLHSPLPTPPRAETHRRVDAFFTRWTHDLSADVLAPHPSSRALELWLGGYAALHAGAVQRALEVYQEDVDTDTDTDTSPAATAAAQHIGVVCQGQAYNPLDPALTRYLHALLRPSYRHSRLVSLRDKASAVPAGSKGLGLGVPRELIEKRERKTSGWAAWPFTRSSTPVGDASSTHAGAAGKGDKGGGGAGAGLSSPAPSVSASAGASVATDSEATGSSSKWLGLGVLGDAVGSVGTVLGMKSKERPTISQPQTHERPSAQAQTQVTSSAAEQVEVATVGLASARIADPDAAGGAEDVPLPPSVRTSVDVPLPELAAAQADPDPGEGVALEWEQRRLWVSPQESDTDRGAWRRVRWLIRDEVLLYLVDMVEESGSSNGSVESAPGRERGDGDVITHGATDPSTAATLSLFNKLAGILHTDSPAQAAIRALHANNASPARHRREVSTSKPPAPPPNTTVHKKPSGAIDVQGEEMDVCGVVIRELKDMLEQAPKLEEVYARTSASRFVVAKRYGHESGRDDAEGEGVTGGALQGTERAGMERQEELYMLVGQKDASLVDADYAVRAFEREHARE